LRRRKIIVLVAASADGFLARKDGGVDWLDRPHVAGDYGMAAFDRSIDTILFGRKTYELALRFQKQGIPGAAFDPKKRNYLFSRRRIRPASPAVALVTESVARFAERLRAEPGKDVWIIGGAGLIASFLDAGQIDEFRIHVIPTMIGEGIPLVAPRRRTVELDLLSSRRFSDGVMLLRYAVRYAAAKRGRRRI
jgi:dihydrofolate reductase